MDETACLCYQSNVSCTGRRGACPPKIRPKVRNGGAVCLQKQLPVSDLLDRIHVGLHQKSASPSMTFGECSPTSHAINAFHVSSHDCYRQGEVFAKGGRCHHRTSVRTTLRGTTTGPNHRPLSSSFLGLPYRVLNINHKNELHMGLWVTLCSGCGRRWARPAIPGHHAMLILP